MKYRAQIETDDGEVLIEISSFTQEGLEEEMGKSKWTKAVEKYEDERHQKLICENCGEREKVAREYFCEPCLELEAKALSEKKGD